MYGGEETCIQVFFLGGGPEGKRPFERRRRRWEDNIKMDLQEERWGMDWIDMVENRGRWGAL